MLTKIHSDHYPPFRAREFLRWVLQLYDSLDIKYIATAWIPEGDNHAQFFEAALSGKPVSEAIESTWSARQFTDNDLGYKPIQYVGIRPVPKQRSPHGYPQVCV